VVRRKSKGGEPPIRYIETSALIAALLEGDRSARASIRTLGRRVTSALTFTEASRAILRARLSGRITAAQHRTAQQSIQRFIARSFIVAITDKILAEAGRPYPIEPVRTRDAIHLATVAALGLSPALVTIVTRDQRVRDNAEALGYAVE
jgi:predicted nucleic acid-binding protein